MNSYRFSELKVGIKESFTIELDMLKLLQFQKISGDCNPLHTDDLYAHKKGFESRVAHGMLTSSFYSTFVGVYLPGKYSLLQGIDIGFIKPVYIGDSLTVSGEIAYINYAYRQIEIKAIIKNQKGEKISRAKIKVGVVDE